MKVLMTLWLLSGQMVVRETDADTCAKVATALVREGAVVVSQPGAIQMPVVQVECYCPPDGEPS